MNTFVVVLTNVIRISKVGYAFRADIDQNEPLCILVVCSYPNEIYLFVELCHEIDIQKTFRQGGHYSNSQLQWFLAFK